MSRITTSCASFSWARPAMRRACSIDVSVSSDPLGCGRSVATSLGVAIEAERLDHLGDGRGNGSVDRLGTRNALADVARRDRQRLDLEELDTIGPRELGENRVEAVTRIPRPGGDCELGPSNHAFRVLPCEEVAELVRTDEEDRVVPAPRLQHVDRPLVRISLDLLRRKSRLCETKTRLAVQLHFLVTRTHRDEHDDLVTEPLFGGVYQREMSVMGRIERAAEQGRHWTSSTSPPTSTSSPVRAPAALSAAVSSFSSDGTSPAMRKPRSVRRTRKRRPPGRGR